MSEGIELSLRFIERYPDSAADTLEAEGADTAAAYLAEVPERLAGPLVARMLPFYASRCLERLGPTRAAGLLREMPASTAALLLRRLSKRLRHQTMSELPRRTASALKLLQRYPVTSVGAWADPAVPVLPEDATVERAWQRLCEEAIDIDRIVSVVDREGRLLGCVRSAALLTADPDVPVARLLDPAVYTFPARADLLTVREHEAWGRGDPIPVTAHDGRYLGVLRYADLRRGLREALDRAPRATVADSLLELADAYWSGAAQLLDGSYGWLSSWRRSRREE